MRLTLVSPCKHVCRVQLNLNGGPGEEMSKGTSKFFVSRNSDVILEREFPIFTTGFLPWWEVTKVNLLHVMRVAAPTVQSTVNEIPVCLLC